MQKDLTKIEQDKTTLTEQNRTDRPRHRSDSSSNIARVRKHEQSICSMGMRSDGSHEHDEARLDSYIQFCDYRYDEGIRSRIEKNVCPTLCAHMRNSEGLSGIPLIIEKWRIR